jgi:flagellar biosynthesis protein FliR
MLEGLAEVLDLSEAALASAVLVFMRIGAIMALLPGFGEQAIPMRVRLGLTVAFTMVVWPLLAPELLAVDPTRPFVAMMVIEAGVGLLFGLSIRLLVMALQFAGAIAAQSTSLAQIFGPNATPDPMPAMGNILMLAGVTLAVTAGLHVKAAVAMAESYAILPMGVPVSGADVAAWGMARVAQAFALGLSLAAPFVIAAFAYNLALGAINRAMPQLMVAFVGAPAITAGGILILLLAAPAILQVWTGRMDATLANPFGLFP